jgi:hypothetical protein
MFEKLLTLLLHGKGALAAGVLVAGTAGVVITGTINGANVNLTVTPAASPATSPLTNTVLSPTTPTNQSSTDTATNCSDAAHLRNDAMTAARVVWAEGRAALQLLAAGTDTASATDKDEKGKEHGKKAAKAFGPARKDIDEARKDALSSIQQEWQSVACAGKGKDDEDKDESKPTNPGSSSSATHKDKDESKPTNPGSTSTATNLSPASPTPTASTSTTTGGNTVTISFDSSKLGRYAKFIDEEVTAINNALKDAASQTTTSKSTHSKKDHDKKSTDSKRHDEDESDDD